MRFVAGIKWDAAAAPARGGIHTPYAEGSVTIRGEGKKKKQKAMFNLSH